MDACIESTNQMLAERGLPIFKSIEDYREVFSFPIKDYYRSLGFDFDKEPYEVLAPLWVDLYNEKSKNSPLIDGVKETLDRVKELDLELVLFSATERNMLLRQLGELGVGEYFDEVIGLDNIHAESKLHLAKAWREAHPDAKIIYVGDTVHDAENAKILGADCLLFAGGHQSKRRLSACGCPVIESIAEIMNYLD